MGMPVKLPRSAVAARPCLHGVMADGDLGNIVSLEFHGVHSTRIRITLRPDKAVGVIGNHFRSDMVVVTEKEMLLADETLAEAVCFFPFDFERPVSVVVNFVAGTNHGVVT